MGTYSINSDIIKNIADKNQNAASSLYRLYCDSGQGVKHSACFVTCIFIEKKSVLTIGSAHLLCNAGNIVIVRSDALFSATTEDIAANDNGALSFILDLNKEFVDDLFMSQIADCPIFYDFFRLPASDKKYQYLFFDCNKSSPVHWCKMAAVYQASILANEKMVRCAMVLFLTELHRCHHETLVISESTMMPQYNIGMFLKYMSDNYKTITLESAAAHFGFSSAYFSVLFKKLARTTFVQKLHEIKTERAKRLLSTSDLPIEEIALMTGYCEKSYFYRSFKRAVGLTPNAYRKQQRTINQTQ